MNYSPALKTTRMQAVADAIGNGGKLEIGTASMALVLASVTLGSPSGTVSGSVLTLGGFPRSDTSADASGTAAEARIRTAANADVITALTVTGSGGGGNIVLDSTSITAGQTVTINSATITHG